MMKKLVFRKIYIYSTGEKQARSLQFDDGINIISSSQVDGTDRGKSVIMRSFYHAMGADCLFDDKWDDNGKTYILLFSIGETEYYIYRCCRLFKFFDGNKQLLFSTIDRKDLAEKLEDYLGFAVQLPNRSEDKLEITPPVYNYLPYFLDQDYYNGTDFSSFNGLAQYAKYKENVLYYHFGVFDAKYFEIITELERLNETKARTERRSALVDGMLAKTSEELSGSTYAADLTALQSEVEMAKGEYSEIVSKLNKVKQHLIALKNQKVELETALSELKEADTNNEKDIELLNQHICPLCSSKLVDTMGLRVSKYHASDDIILVSNDIQRSVLELHSKIESETDKYKDLLSLLEEYEIKLNMNSVQVNDVLKHRGLIKVRDSLLIELEQLKQSLSKIKVDNGVLNKKRREYDAVKKAINKKYYELLICDKIIFGLSEIDDKKFENITGRFTASGSNKPIATVMWYTNLIKLKNEFNPGAIKFPVVFDSPNNAETDDVKKHELLAYLLKNATKENQLIISTIGFDEHSFSSDIQCNIISLTNEKYHLLSETEFEKHSPLLVELCNRQ